MGAGRYGPLFVSQIYNKIITKLSQIRDKLCNIKERLEGVVTNERV